MMAENARGFHHPRQSNFADEHMRGSSGEAGPHGPAHKHMAEPTNHGGHTHEMARRHESDARIESIRDKHAAHHGHREHEQILHDTHKLHNGDYTSHGNKHGAAHHWREGNGE
jgi:hypothetical protein